ncbi:hypothetical protein ACFP7A_09665 [Sporolactobacillus kofuensis]|uniref:DUF948 domain-containing protein n=1 Tax=Sporolactobacillus kofuensis TaxID=269672 RepID=A0ABW1WIH6_9BACL|nr:hypothetical protein [Sporolactobacillus kofuensis]MCO7176012.1 hypothetical protein [Sporolactobacillus kofuensis]
MIIVYLSFVLVVISLVAFAASVRNTLKLMNGSLAKISKTSATMTRQSKKIMHEKDELTRNLTMIQQDMTKKKDTIQETIREVNDSALHAQVAWYKGKAIFKRQTD